MIRTRQHANCLRKTLPERTGQGVHAKGYLPTKEKEKRKKTSYVNISRLLGEALAARVMGEVRRMNVDRCKRFNNSESWCYINTCCNTSLPP